MATGGETEEQCEDILGSDDLENLKCQPCQEDGELREAVGLCTDCQEYLCQRCFDVHRIPKVTRAHKLLDKHQMLESQIQLAKKDRCTEICPQHDDEFIKYYCKVHDQLSCSVCLNLNHRTCKGVLYISDVASDLANNAEYKQVEDQFSSVFRKSKKVAEHLKHDSKAFEDSHAIALEKMEDFRRELNDAVDKKKTEMVKQAGVMKSTKMNQIGSANETCEMAATELQYTMTKMDTFRNSKQYCNMFIEMMKVKNNLNSLDDQLNKAEKGQIAINCTLKFVPNLDTLDVLRLNKSFGIHVLCFTEGDDQPDGTLGARTVIKAKHAYDIHVKTSEDQNNCNFTGSALLPNNTLVVTDCSNNTVEAVDVKQCRVITKLWLPSAPWDVATIDNNKVAVTLPEDRTVVFVTVGADIAVEKDMPMRGQCYGVDFEDGKLAVSFRYPDQVKVMDLKGTVLHHITNDKIGQTLLNGPYYLSFSPSGTALYVSNYGSHNVVCLSLDGIVLATYNDKTLRGPEKVLADNDGNVFVCARDSNNIHLLTPDSKITRELMSEADGLQEPHTVSYSVSEKKLFVGMYNWNDIKVYEAILG